MSKHKLKNPDLGAITIVGIPKTSIDKLNAIAKNKFGVSRNAFMKTKIFEIIKESEAEARDKGI